MHDSGTISWMSADPGRFGMDGSTGDVVSSLDARWGRPGSVRTQAARPTPEFAECECPYDCLRDHENE